VPALRPPFLVHLPSAKSREGQTDPGVGLVSRHARCVLCFLTRRLDTDDNSDDVDDDDEFEDEDDRDEEDDDEEDDEDEETETWQVSSGTGFP
jgi:hypothetical protein